MGIPIKTALDVFDGEPMKLLLGMHARVLELRDEAQAEESESGEASEFDPVTYVVSAAMNRGWGIYREREPTVEEVRVTEEQAKNEVVEFDLSPIDDDVMYERMAYLMQEEADWLRSYLQYAITHDHKLRFNLDTRIAKKEGREPPNRDDYPFEGDPYVKRPA